jgi:omega-6 fatty acid desaturase (delta-12 desaturase)
MKFNKLKTLYDLNSVLVKPAEGISLLEKTRVFAVEDRKKSWGYVISTFGILLFLLALNAYLPSTFWFVILKTGISVICGLLMMRGFIFYHDFMHGAILQGSMAAKVILFAFGALLLTPPTSWAQSHNFHHGHVGMVEGSHIGSFKIMTTEDYKAASWGERLDYKLHRHPIVFALALVFVFLINICIAPIFQDVNKHKDSIFAVLFSVGIGVGLWFIGGFPMLFFVYLLPLWIASAFGAYLFYAQHNVRDLKVFKKENWNYSQAALEASSFIKMSKIMHWFTGNIGYHHIHHLNPRIPFYRLPDAMASIPELQHPITTTLHPKDMWDCLRLKLWDEDHHEFQGFN